MKALLYPIKNIFAILLLTGLFLWGGNSQAQIGNVIWEEQFNTLDNWIIAEGNGSWGWGNGELEYYKKENVSISPVPGEPGNNALKLVAKQESGPGIVDQWGNPLNYTSGRVFSKSKVAIKYGVIEARVRVPDLDLGGWPAVWMLGTSNLPWPSKGEIDIMEMGHQKSYRDLHDGHNGGNGMNNSTVNQMVMANAIFYADFAVVPQNPSGAASLNWDPTDDFNRPYYNYTTPLNDRFLTYRTYWNEDSLRFTVIDNGMEFDLFTNATQIDSHAYEFQDPFYLLANLAIGGAFTDAYNLGDPASGAPVSMPFPAEMYVDYIKVMEWNGAGEVHLGPPTPKTGTFGLYTETTPIDDSLLYGLNGEIYAWEGTLTGGSIPAFEGDDVLSWQTANKGWFGAGISSHQPLNLFNFGAGHIKFRIKIPANVTFKIGIIDCWGNQNYVSFPANQTTYGLVRDGEWGQAAIPVADIRGLHMDLRTLNYAFVILEENGVACEFALDDIYWDGGVTGIDEDLNAGFQLATNYPNPFESTTTIGYTLPRTAEVTISIHDVTGRLVETLVEQKQGAGTYSVDWHAADQAPGVYFYKIQAGTFNAVKKCILQR
jgi:beta-glucanase (GH16 family)